MDEGSSAARERLAAFDNFDEAWVARLDPGRGDGHFW